MGSGRWDAGAWSSYASTNIKGKSAAQVFTSTSIKTDYDPKGIDKRESRDSADNPQATPILLASDVTGSMGMIAHQLMQTGLNTLATEIYDRKPVTDPHIAVLAVGDAYTDRAPLQATQFEADIRLADQVRDLWIEGCGGGNQGESYALAHAFAAFKTSTDAFEKRGKKGYLITIGDEPILPVTRKEDLERIFGGNWESDLKTQDAIDMARRKWEVFHIALVNEGYCRHGRDAVLQSWNAVLPERVVQLENVEDLAETVTSLIQVHEGANADSVAASWSGSTAVVVANALKTVATRGASQTGLRRLG